MLACHFGLSPAYQPVWKLMAKRIAKAAIRTGALRNTQFGAVENRSVIDALFVIVHPAAEAISIPIKSGKQARGLGRPAFLANDIQGAFNNMDPARLVQIIETRHLPAALGRLLHSSQDNGFLFRQRGGGTIAVRFGSSPRLSHLPSPFPDLRSNDAGRSESGVYQGQRYLIPG